MRWKLASARFTNWPGAGAVTSQVTRMAPPKWVHGPYQALRSLHRALLLLLPPLPLWQRQLSRLPRSALPPVTAHIAW